MADMNITISFGDHMVSTSIEMAETPANEESDFREFALQCQEKLKQALNSIHDLSDIPGYKVL